ncbi:MAG: double-strand break repair protein AddB [Robiginitomaculum sp.]|nr:double-strand break repair protein AddB [Robiginitomaculum sp.]
MAKFQTLFKADTPNIYTMPPSADFLGQLARGLTSALGEDLHKSVILLPTRRAVRELESAFLKTTKDERAMLLPLMRPLADMDINEPPFSMGTAELDIAPAMEAARYRFELARFVARKMKVDGQTPDAAAALAMTEPLSQLLSDLAMEELGPDALSALDDKLETLPAHFQDAAEFIKIIATYWPAYLAEQGVTEPAARRVALLKACSALWRETPPEHPVIIAGSTGTMAATAQLIKTVYELPMGLVVLPGLDTHIDDHVWDAIKIDDQHPQASLSHLLSVLNVNRRDVKNWPGITLSRSAKMRARILGESLIPANTTSDWPARIASVRASDSTGEAFKSGLEGLSLIEAKTEEEEASVLALIMREALETADKTAVLITPDPSLARRVKAKLSRYGVNVDTSQGEPLEETSHGSFLSLCAHLAFDPFDPIAMSTLVGHSLFARKEDVQNYWYGFEKRALRGPRPSSFAAIEEKLKGKYQDGLAIYKYIHKALVPLTEAAQQICTASDLAYIHTQIVEDLAGGVDKIWQGEAGEKAAQILEALIAHGELLPAFEPSKQSGASPANGQGYLQLLGQMMRGRVVRPRYGMSERVQILGPLEARMIQADIILLGGLNEGIWPAPPSPHPMLSRDMRSQIGLTVPERRFGLAAHDFAQLAAKDNVVLSRALRTSDGPSIQSRWLWRLTTLIKGAALGSEGTLVETLQGNGEKYLNWARQLDAPRQKLNPASRPMPAPPLSSRWPSGRGLSVTQIQKWIRDPYSIYAKKILGLAPIDPLDQDMGGREYGKAIHKALEHIDGKTASELAQCLEDELRRAGYKDHSFSRHKIRLDNMANWLVDWAQSRREQGWSLAGIETKAGIEVKDRLEMSDIGDTFTLTGVADRIEIRGNEAAIIDYKTGTITGQKAIARGFDPQLPLLSVMLVSGCFKVKAEVSEMRYVKPNDRSPAKRDVRVKSKDYDAQRYQIEALDALENLIDYFDTPDSVYASQPRALYVNPYGDYDHLARRAEWARLVGDDKGGE